MELTKRKTRNRKAASCNQCSYKKARCSRGDPCSRCESKGLACSWDLAKSTGPLFSTRDATRERNEAENLRQQVDYLQNLVDTLLACQYVASTGGTSSEALPSSSQYYPIAGISPASSSSTGLSNPFESTDDDLIAQDLVPAIGRLTIQQFLKGELKKEGEGPESWEAEDRNLLQRPPSSDAPAHRELIQGALHKIAAQGKVSALCRRGEKVLEWLVHKDAQLEQRIDSTVAPRREPIHTLAFDQDLTRPAFSEIRSNSEGSDRSRWIPTSGSDSGFNPIPFNSSSDCLNTIPRQYYESNAPQYQAPGSFAPPHHQHIPLYSASDPWQSPFFLSPCNNQHFIPDPKYQFPSNRDSMGKAIIDNLPLFAPPHDPPRNLFYPSSTIASQEGCEFSEVSLPLEPEFSTARESIDTRFLEYNSLGGVYGISHSMGWE